MVKLNRKRPQDQTNQEWLEEYKQAYDEFYQPKEVNEMDMSQYSTTEGKDLKAKDFIGKNLKVKISKVEIRDYPATDDQAASQKPALHFEGKEKTLVLNATNTKILCEGYGNDSDGWVGKHVGLSVVDYTSKGFGHGWTVKALDAPEPEFIDDDIPW